MVDWAKLVDDLAPGEEASNEGADPPAQTAASPTPEVSEESALSPGGAQKAEAGFVPASPVDDDGESTAVGSDRASVGPWEVQPSAEPERPESTIISDITDPSLGTVSREQAAQIPMEPGKGVPTQPAGAPVHEDFDGPTEITEDGPAVAPPGAAGPSAPAAEHNERSTQISTQPPTGRSDPGAGEAGFPRASEPAGGHTERWTSAPAQPSSLAHVAPMPKPLKLDSPPVAGGQTEQWRPAPSRVSSLDGGGGVIGDPAQANTTVSTEPELAPHSDHAGATVPALQRPPPQMITGVQKPLPTANIVADDDDDDDPTEIKTAEIGIPQTQLPSSEAVEAVPGPAGAQGPSTFGAEAPARVTDPQFTLSGLGAMSGPTGLMPSPSPQRGDEWRESVGPQMGQAPLEPTSAGQITPLDDDDDTATELHSQGLQPDDDDDTATSLTAPEDQDSTETHTALVSPADDEGDFFTTEAADPHAPDVEDKLTSSEGGPAWEEPSHYSRPELEPHGPDDEDPDVVMARERKKTRLVAIAVVGVFVLAAIGAGGLVLGLEPPKVPGDELVEAPPDDGSDEKRETGWDAPEGAGGEKKAPAASTATDSKTPEDEPAVATREVTPDDDRRTVRATTDKEEEPATRASSSRGGADEPTRGAPVRGAKAEDPPKKTEPPVRIVKTGDRGDRRRAKSGDDDRASSKRDRSKASDSKEERTRADTRVAGATDRQVSVIAPSRIKWLTPTGRQLGKGSGFINVPAGVSSVLALDSTTDVRTFVRVTGDSVNYDKLPKGKLDIRAFPYAAVYAGKRKLGDAPFPPLEVVEGQYRLRLEYKDRVERRTVKVRAGKTVRVKVMFEKPGGP